MEDLIKISSGDRSSATYSDIASLMEVDPLQQISLAKQSVPQDCRLRYHQTVIKHEVIENQRAGYSENTVSLQNGLNIDGKLYMQRIFFAHLKSNAN
jgi:hypothetical protein